MPRIYIRQKGLPRPICRQCHKNPCTSTGWLKSGFRRWSTLCNGCKQRKYNLKPFVKKKDRCEQCGFTPVDRCQMDIHHINGDHHDSRKENLKVLCSNCHRLEHFSVNKFPTNQFVPNKKGYSNASITI